MIKYTYVCTKILKEYIYFQKQSQYVPNCPRTLYVDQAGLAYRDPLPLPPES